jgi:hypothetical protein
VFLWWDGILQQATAAEKPWSQFEKYRRLPLACIAGPAIVISRFWVGWTSRVDVHWIVPMLSGIPFGLGFLLIFMALLNYLVDAHEIYSASALAASTFSRSIFGAALPFASQKMYTTLGINWAYSLLGVVGLAMMIVPFVWIRYGKTIRAHSKFCQYLLQEKEKAAKDNTSDSIEDPKARKEAEKV